MNNMTYGIASIRSRFHSKLSKKMSAEDFALTEVEGYKYYGYKQTRSGNTYFTYEKRNGGLASWFSPHLYYTTCLLI